MSDKRQQLKVAATQAVQRTGLSNLSFRTLAEQVGIKSSSVHYYFPEKAHLASAVIEHYRTEFKSQLDHITAESKSPLQRLLSFVDLFEQSLAEDKFCLCGMLAAEVDSLSKDNRAELDHYFLDVQQWLVDIIDSSAGGVGARGNLSSETAARSLLSGLEGALLLDRLHGSANNLRAQKVLIQHLFADKASC